MSKYKSQQTVVKRNVMVNDNLLMKFYNFFLENDPKFTKFIHKNTFNSQLECIIDYCKYRTSYSYPFNIIDRKFFFLCSYLNYKSSQGLHAKKINIHGNQLDTMEEIDYCSFVYDPNVRYLYEPSLFDRPDYDDTLHVNIIGQADYTSCVRKSNIDVITDICVLYMQKIDI